MLEADDPGPGMPDPTTVRTREALTGALRDLHLACGRPTYEALSARTGLPKSAISYLVGRNPVRQPSSGVVVRFVEGCLTYAGRGPAEAAREADRWRRAHEALVDAAADPVPAIAPAAETPAAAEAPLRRRGRRWLAVAGAGFAVLVTLVAVGLVRSPGGGTPAQGQVAPAASPAVTTASPAPTPTSSAAGAPESGATCVERAEPQSDARLGRDWPSVFYCPNRPSSVYAWAREDGRPVADLESRDSWFVCWTEGRSRGGAAEVFYYTQGDTTWRRPELDAWGFVPAKAVAGPAAPAVGVTRRCPFSTSG